MSENINQIMRSQIAKTYIRFDFYSCLTSELQSLKMDGIKLK